MKKFLVTMILFSMAAITQASVMLNGSFETGDTSDWWYDQTGTASVGVDNTMASDGNFSLLAASAGDPWAEEARFGQYFDFNASQAGEEVVITFDYYAVTGDVIGINLDYYTDAKHWLGWSEITPDTGMWVSEEVTFELPEGTYALDLKFIVTGESEIHFDNFSATVPEPASMLLLGLGAMTSLRRRK